MADASAPRRFPVFLDLADRLAVIVGTGSSAEKRARQLQRAGADIVVITPAPTVALESAEAEGVLTIEKRPYVRGDLEGAFFVLCLEEDDEIRRAVFSEAESRGSLCNVAGVPELCSFLLPSVVRRESLEIAISTGGAAPEAARAVSRRISQEFGDEWGAWISLIADARLLAAALEDDAVAARFMAAVTDPGVVTRIAEEAVSARRILREVKEEEGAGS